jgi:tetratricopeptide (TPR) repeat protein
MTQAGRFPDEAADAEKVAAAISLLGSGKLDRAEQILREVAANTPEGYVNAYEEGDTLFIKFWDMGEFLYYVARQKEAGAQRGVTWIGNAYPRACYYLGFIAVERKQYAEAIHWLDAGIALEPDQANLHLEKAKAVAFNGDLTGAMQLYQEILERGEEVMPTTRAAALRGMGGQLIDMGLLDDAEQCFQDSLAFDPESHVAKNELGYIQHLRAGGEQAPTILSSNKVTEATRCALCGQESASGRIVTIEGKSAFVCERCLNKQNKKWWQFWR